MRDPHSRLVYASERDQRFDGIGPEAELVRLAYPAWKGPCEHRLEVPACLLSVLERELEHPQRTVRGGGADCAGLVRQSGAIGVRRRMTKDKN